MIKRLKMGLFHENTHTHTHTHNDKRKTRERKFYTQAQEESILSFCRNSLYRDKHKHSDDANI